MIFFLASCGTSCKDFSWEPNPYRARHEDQTLTNADGEMVRCDQPRFNEFTCFDAENIAALITAIDEINGIKKKDKKKIIKHINKTFNNPALKSLSRGVRVLP